MTQPITYHVISPDMLDRLLREAARPDRMLRPRDVKAQFGIEPDMLTKLVREGKITKYIEPDHSKLVRYKESELFKLFKPIT